MKKILFTLNPNHKSNSVGGGNNFILKLSKFLKKNNFKVIYQI